MADRRLCFISRNPTIPIISSLMRGALKKESPRCRSIFRTCLDERCLAKYSSSDLFSRRNGVKLVRGEGERALWRCTTIHLALHWVSAQEPAISGQALPSANCATPPPSPHPSHQPTNQTIFRANFDTQQSKSSNIALALSADQ